MAMEGSGVSLDMAACINSIGTWAIAWGLNGVEEKLVFGNGSETDIYSAVCQLHEAAVGEPPEAVAMGGTITTTLIIVMLKNALRHLAAKYELNVDWLIDMI